MQRILIAVVGTLALGAGALGAGAASSATTVNVSLREYRVSPSKSSVTPQKVTFSVTNRGELTHELEVVKWSRGVGAIPVKNNKATFDDDLELGEVEDIEPGQTKRFSVNLKRGKYVLLCNVAGHYKLGQRARFTVTG